MQSFLVNFPRLTPATTRHGTADVAFVRQIGGEADPFALIKNRREHSHIRGVRAAAQIRMIGNERVALMHFVGIVIF